VGVGDGVLDHVPVTVRVGVAVKVFVPVGVKVRVTVWVGVKEKVLVRVDVNVAVGGTPVHVIVAV
jgi:hypothetical protein